MDVALCPVLLAGQPADGELVGTDTAAERDDVSSFAGSVALAAWGAGVLAEVRCELEVLDRVMYKHQSQQRKTIPFQKLREARRWIHRVLDSTATSELADLAAHIRALKHRQGVGLAGVACQWAVARIVALGRLHVETDKRTRKVFEHYTGMMCQTIFIPLAMTICSLMARLRVLLHHRFHHLRIAHFQLAAHPAVQDAKPHYPVLALCVEGTLEVVAAYPSTLRDALPKISEEMVRGDAAALSHDGPFAFGGAASVDLGVEMDNDFLGAAVVGERPARTERRVGEEAAGGDHVEGGLEATVVLPPSEVKGGEAGRKASPTGVGVSDKAARLLQMTAAVQAGKIGKSAAPMDKSKGQGRKAAKMKMEGQHGGGGRDLKSIRPATGSAVITKKRKKRKHAAGSASKQTTKKTKQKAPLPAGPDDLFAISTPPKKASKAPSFATKLRAKARAKNNGATGGGKSSKAEADMDAIFGGF